MAICLWPLADKAPSKEHQTEAETWEMSQLLLWLGLLFCITGKEKQVRKLEERVPAKGWSHRGEVAAKRNLLLFLKMD